MQIRRVALQLWTVISIAWLAASGLLAASAFLEARFTDSVRLEQHAKDLRNAGIDPATVDWTIPVVAHGFFVPPAQLKAPQFWVTQGGFYISLAGSLPVVLLVLIESVAASNKALRISAQRGKMSGGSLANLRSV